MNETLTIRLGQKFASALENESRQTGLTKAEIIRQALQARLQGSGNFSVMRHHFGTIRGPSDLSTNKKYRQGWR